MSTTLDRPSAKRVSAALAGAPRLPQVNLLPPEVRAARGLVHLKKWLAAILVAVLLLVGVVYAVAHLARAGAEAELETAMADAADLQVELRTYAEVPVVLNNLERTEQARELGMSNEVLWKTYIDAVTAVLPANTTIDSYSVVQGTPWLAAPAPMSPLATQGIGTLSFSSRAATLPDSAAWIDALNAIPNFSDATFVSATITQETADPYYLVTSTVEVGSGAVANRFIETPEG